VLTESTLIVPQLSTLKNGGAAPPLYANVIGAHTKTEVVSSTLQVSPQAWKAGIWKWTCATSAPQNLNPTQAPRSRTVAP